MPKNISPPEALHVRPRLHVPALPGTPQHDSDWAPQCRHFSAPFASRQTLVGLSHCLFAQQSWFSFPHGVQFPSQTNPRLHTLFLQQAWLLSPHGPHTLLKKSQPRPAAHSSPVVQHAWPVSPHVRRQDPFMHAWFCGQPPALSSVTHEPPLQVLQAPQVSTTC